MKVLAELKNKIKFSERKELNKYIEILKKRKSSEAKGDDY